MIGARPSQGSSSSSSVGFNTRARPTPAFAAHRRTTAYPGSGGVQPAGKELVDPLGCPFARPVRAGRATAVRFSCTVSDLKMLRSCGTQPMPAAARSCEGKRCNASTADPTPSMMLPPCCRVAPASVLISVVLPVPLRPSSASVWPSCPGTARHRAAPRLRHNRRSGSAHLQQLSHGGCLPSVRRRWLR
jgi:hypothetical protein